MARMKAKASIISRMAEWIMEDALTEDLREADEAFAESIQGTVRSLTAAYLRLRHRGVKLIQRDLADRGRAQALEMINTDAIDNPPAISREEAAAILETTIDRLDDLPLDEVRICRDQLFLFRACWFDR